MFLKLKNILSRHGIFLLLIIIFGALVSTPFLSKKMIFGHDFYFNQARIESTYNSLKDGQIIPQYDPTAFGGWGHSWNIFYGPLPAYITAPFYLITDSIPFSLNIISILLIVLSGISTYLALFLITKNKSIAIFTALLFMLAAPIVLSDYRSNNQSRMIITVLAPLMLLGLYRIIHNQKAGVLIFALSITGMILSHLLSTGLSLILAFLVAMYYFKKTFQPKIILNFLKSFALAFGISAFFILPFFEAMKSGHYNISNDEFKTTAMSMVPKTFYDSSFTFGELFFRNQEYPERGIFVTYIVLILTAIISLFIRQFTTKKIYKNILAGWILLASLFIVSTPYLPWNYIPEALYSLQFPSRRITLYICLIASILGAFGLYYLIPKSKNPKNNQRIILITSFLIAFLSIQTIYPMIGYYSSKDVYSDKKPTKILHYINDRSPIPEEVWKDQIEILGVSSGEYLPHNLSVAGDRNPSSSKYFSYTVSSANFLIKRGNQPEVTEGKISIDNFSKNGSSQKIIFSQSENDSFKIEFPAIYYPGFKANFIDENGKSQNLKTSISKNGLVEVSIPGGLSSKGKIHIWFGMSTATKIGSFITLITLIFMTIFFLNKHKSIATSFINKKIKV